MTTRQWFRVHSFTGVITGLLLFVICWSGTFAVLAPELDWLATPERHVSPSPGLASWGDIEAAALRQVPGEVNYLSAPLHRYDAATVYLSKNDGGNAMVWVDPYTGDVTGQANHNYSIKRFFRNFHRMLSLPRVGLYLVCLFSLTMLISVIAALFVYKRWWTRFFRLKLSNPKTRWSELHKTLGLWSIWFALVIALTGVWYLFEAGRSDFGDGKVSYVGDVVTIAAPEQIANDHRDMDTLMRYAAQAWPELEVKRVAYGWHSGSEHTVYIAGQTDFPLVRDRTHQMHLDRRTGQILWQGGAADLSAYWLWSNMADPLHFGNFAGLFSKVIWFVFGLVLSGLIYTGTYLHAKRLMRNPASRQMHRWSGTLGATVVSVIVLGLSVPAELLTAKNSYGTTADGVAHFPQLGTGILLIITGWTLATLLLIAAWIRMLLGKTQRGV